MVVETADSRVTRADTASMIECCKERSVLARLISLV
jgi:hypothetical protein